ncbi:MAG: tetratricopeptide repeat protein [Candidatus Cloacimonetes bacterium]|nr:tetratricopeptide repeat protein [Candidatus Cloacimonadota bacterium]
MKKLYILLLFIVLIPGLRADLRFARDLFENGLWDESIAEFQKVIDEAPTSPEAESSLLYIGEAYQNLQHYEEAEASFRKLLEGYPLSSLRDRALAYLADVQAQQGKFQQAVGNYRMLLDQFPLTENAKNALKSYLSALFEAGSYQQVINIGPGLIKNYTDSKQIPELLLIMARSHEKLGQQTEMEEILNRLQKEYPEHPAYWESLRIKAGYLEKHKRDPELIAFLEQVLQKSVPRHQEEILGYQLAQLYLKQQNFQEAYQLLSKLKEKFNHSGSYADYLTDLAYTRLKLARYEELIDEPDPGKPLQASQRRDEYMYYIAEAYFHLQDYQSADNLLTQLLTTSDTMTAYQAGFLQASLQAATGRYQLAVDKFLNLLNNPHSDQLDIYREVGRIYKEGIRDYQQAVKYLQLALLGNPAVRQQAEIVNLISESYESMGDYQSALQVLEQLTSVTSLEQQVQQEIELRRKYLHHYRVKDFESGFYSLLEALSSYLQTGEQETLNMNILNILSRDLKDHRRALELLSGKADDESCYLRARLYLKSAARYLAEDKQMTAEQEIESALDAIQILDEEIYHNWQQDISLQSELLLLVKIDSAFSSRLENHLQLYPESAYANNFRLALIDYYRNNNRSMEALTHLENLSLDDEIMPLDYYRAKLQLAEYYYRMDDDENAVRNYTLAEKQLSLNYPSEYFHYAVALSQTGDRNRAVDMLIFLVNNARVFPDYQIAVKFLTELLEEQERFAEAVHYYQLIPENDRDTEFYTRLAGLYKILGDKEQAKYALLHIEDKTENILRDLAYLQYETADIAMASYSFQKLTEMNNAKLEYYDMLGHIAFIQKQFLAAAENYKVVVDKIEQDLKSYKNIRQLGRENIISLYRIGNRPKAEALIRKFDSFLIEDDRHHVLQAEALYYLEMDPKQAEKKFNDLLKTNNLSSSIREESHFWRGVARLEQNRISEAEEDFLIVRASNDQNLRNQADLKLGSIKFSQGDYQGALGHYYSVIEHDREGELAWTAASNFAFVCKTIGSWQQAVAAYEIILERWGDQDLQGETLFNIAYCHLRDKQYQSAIEIFNRCLALLPSREIQAEAQYWIGESYLNLGDRENAVTEFLKVSYNYSEFTNWAASAELSAAEVYFSSGDYDKSRRLFERVISKYGETSQWGTEARKKLQNWN